MLSYKNLADTNSMFKYVTPPFPFLSLSPYLCPSLSLPYSTPPTFTIYVCSLVLSSLLQSPPLPRDPSSRPLSPLQSYASKKSSLVYTALDDSNGFYEGTANKDSRSRMNCTFRIKGGHVELEKKFVKLAGERGIKGVSGHRSVGGTFSLSFFSVCF